MTPASYRVRARVPGLAFASFTRDREGEVGADGHADHAKRTAATAGTVFEAASIGKTMIAVAVMQLVDERKLDIDADVTPLVGFPVRHPRSAEPITLRLLLTHRAGLVDRDAELLAPRAAAPLGDFLRGYLVRDGAPRREAYGDATPGARVRYSNVGAALAAYAAERAAGLTFDELTRRRVFEPLGMRDTRWTASTGAGGDAGGGGGAAGAAGAAGVVAVALPHAYADGGFKALPPASHAIYPVVDLHSTARDLTRFGRAILRGGELDGTRILSEPSVRAMFIAHDASGEQGLAWQLRTVGGRAVVGHEGEDRGATTALFLDRSAGRGAVVLANGDAFASEDPARAAAVQELLAALLERSPSPPTTPPVSSTDAH